MIPAPDPRAGEPPDPAPAPPAQGLRATMRDLAGHAGSPRRALRTLLHHLTHDHTSPPRLAWAVAVGLFIGASPFYGFHLLLCAAASLAFRLNPLVVYLAANISNPLFAPFLVLAELHIGSLALTGAPASLPLADLKARMSADMLGTMTDLAASLMAPLLLGSVVLGGVLGALGGLATLAGARRRADRAASHGALAGADDPGIAGAIARVAARARGLPSRFDQGYVRSKLRMDPVFRVVVREVQPAATVADVGCGRGLLLAVLREAGRGTRLWGVDWDAGRLDTARRLVAGPGVDLVRGDVREAEIPDSDAVALIDVLHYLTPGEQHALFERAARGVRPGGRLLLRDMDALPGRGGALHRVQERVTTALGLNRGERVSPPDLDRLQRALEARGFRVRSLRLAGWFGSTDRLLVAEAPPHDG